MELEQKLAELVRFYQAGFIEPLYEACSHTTNVQENNGADSLNI